MTSVDAPKDDPKAGAALSNLSKKIQKAEKPPVAEKPKEKGKPMDEVKLKVTDKVAEKKEKSKAKEEVKAKAKEEPKAKAKEEAKNISGAKSTINMARKTLELSTSLDDAGKQAILDRIDALQAVLDEGKSPTEGMIKKLKDLL